MALSAIVVLGFSVTGIGHALQQQQQQVNSEVLGTSTLPLKGSQPEGSWDCGDKAKFVWKDSNYGTVDGKISHDTVASALKGKWVLLAGDSSLRMVYHLLLGVLRWNWTTWPLDVNNHGPSYYVAPKQSVPFNCSIEHNTENPDESFCLQDTTSDGIRLSFLWMDYGHENQTHPLVALRKRETPSALSWKGESPDVVVFSMGAWHVRDDLLNLLKVNLGSAMSKVEEMFPASRKIVAGVPNCNGNPNANTDAAKKVMLDTIPHHPDWSFFDRGSVVKKVCVGDHACQLGWPHPIGAPLNAVAKLLLMQIQDAAAQKSAKDSKHEK
eukprot:TRINITY_DN244_c0_g2_i2.p1 TRINITY_DN244_c0_g2~~TRINITY_DN244_c0_g2_i2.p1  ORF type:complete len:325 (+),score=51.04 TRINITY_DN244_c0_g2_i2:70-1044(+)